MTETGAKNSGDKSARKAAWCLFLIAAPLAEILSENQPLLSFFSPVAFIFMTLSYGVPVLLIRELTVARRLSVAGIFLLGLAYGILNEGILAKTLTQPSGQPVGDFAGWGQAGMLQGGWALMIVPWHALHSVLYPILMTHWLFPAAAGRRWLHGRWLKALLVLLFALYSLYFLREERRELSSFIVYAVATAGLVWSALRCAAPELNAAALPVSRKPVFLGTLTLLFYMFQFVAARRMPFAVYAVITAGVYVLALWRMKKSGWRPAPEVLLFGLGDDLMFSAFAAFFCVQKGNAPIQALVAETVFLAAFLWLIRAVRRAPQGRGTGAL